MPAYTTYDASIGVAKDNWTVQVTGSNITNSDASTLTSSAQFIESQVPLRPRVLMADVQHEVRRRDARATPPRSPRAPAASPAAGPRPWWRPASAAAATAAGASGRKCCKA